MQLKKAVQTLISVIFIIFGNVSVCNAQQELEDEFVTKSELPESSNIKEVESSVSVSSDGTESQFIEEGTETTQTTEDASSTTQENVPFEFLKEKDKVPRGSVVLESAPEYDLSYKNRRGRHGVLFSISMEKYYPLDYYSLFRDAYIENVTGENDIDLLAVEIGYKFNFALGSISVLGNIAQGTAQEKKALITRSISVRRQGLSVGLALDNIFNEPYVVPYGQVGGHQFLVDEHYGDESDAITTSISTNYKIGLLFQLDWIERAIDPTTHLRGMQSSGLQNTYLDIYMMAHQSSPDLFDPTVADSVGDPDMGNDPQYGVGLKMEF